MFTELLRNAASLTETPAPRTCCGTCIHIHGKKCTVLNTCSRDIVNCSFHSSFALNFELSSYTPTPYIDDWNDYTFFRWGFDSALALFPRYPKSRKKNVSRYCFGSLENGKVLLSRRRSTGWTERTNSKARTHRVSLADPPLRS